MTHDAATVVDAALWSAVVALLAMALYLSRPRPRSWNPARMFALCRAILDGQPGEDALHHPSARVGVACTDEALRRWREGAAEAEVAAALARRSCTVLWWGPPAWTLGGWPSQELGTEATPELEARLEGLLAERARRFVIVVTAGAETFFPFFADVPGLRDRTRAVVLAGADLGAAADWLAERFSHDTLDLELDRALPYLTLRTAPGQVLRQPAPDPTGREGVEVIDLGEVDALDADLGRALQLVLAALA